MKTKVNRDRGRTVFSPDSLDSLDSLTVYTENERYMANG